MIDSKDILPKGTVVRVTAEGKGSYTGSIRTTYRIVECNIAKAKITVKKQTYTGKAIIPGKEDITVKINGMTLNPEDYEIVSCSSIINKGNKAKITIRGRGNFGGTANGTFSIKTKVSRWRWE